MKDIANMEQVALAVKLLVCSEKSMSRHLNGI